MNLSTGVVTTALSGSAGGGSVCVFGLIGLLTFVATGGGISSSLTAPPLVTFLIKLSISLK